MYIILYSMRRWTLSNIIHEKRTIWSLYTNRSLLTVDLKKKKTVPLWDFLPLFFLFFFFKDVEDVTYCHIFRSCSACLCCQDTVLLVTTWPTSYPSPAIMTLQMKDIQRGRNKMKSPDRELISWRAETGGRFPSRPLQIPSLLSSAESKMQLTGKKKDAIDFSLSSPLSLCLLFISLPLSLSLGIILLSLFSLCTFGIPMLI